MSISFIGSIKRWKGLSSDHKPLEDIPSGSTFDETDTGRRYFWLSNQWIEDLSGSLSIARSLELYTEQNTLLEQILIEIIATNRANGIEPV